MFFHHYYVVQKQKYARYQFQLFEFQLDQKHYAAAEWCRPWDILFCAACG
jgi:hypothetical protein